MVIRGEKGREFGKGGRQEERRGEERKKRIRDEVKQRGDKRCGHKITAFDFLLHGIEIMEQG